MALEVKEVAMQETGFGGDSVTERNGEAQWLHDCQLALVQ